MKYINYIAIILAFTSMQSFAIGYSNDGEQLEFYIGKQYCKYLTHTESNPHPQNIGTIEDLGRGFAVKTLKGMKSDYTRVAFRITCAYPQWTGSVVLTHINYKSRPTYNFQNFLGYCSYSFLKGNEEPCNSEDYNSLYKTNYHLFRKASNIGISNTNNIERLAKLVIAGHGVSFAGWSHPLRIVIITFRPALT